MAAELISESTTFAPMFSRYWRTYPFFLQFILFALMVFTLMSFGTLIGLLVIPKVFGATPLDIANLGPDSPINVSRAAIWFNIIWHPFTFLLPCLLFANLATPRPAEYLALRRPANMAQLLAVVGLMLGYLALSLPLESYLVKYMHLPQSLRSAAEKLERMNQGIMKFKNPGDLLRLLLLVGVLVPIGEELMFRAMITRFTARFSRSIHLPIIVSSLAFGFVHENPYGLVFIIIAGFLLGHIVWRTGSLWCSILAHAVFNATQVIMAYYSPSGASETNSSAPPYVALVGLLLMAGCGWWLYKVSTPLPLSWAKDFNEDELRIDRDKWDMNARNDS